MKISRYIYRFFLTSVILFILAGCLSKTGPSPFNKTETEEHTYDLEDIQDVGELIVLTLYGANSYFDFHGEDFGYQFRLAEDFATKIGTTIRVEVMNDEQEMVSKFLSGEGDMIAYNLNMADTLSDRLIYCGEDEITYFLDSISKLTGHTSPQESQDRHKTDNGSQAWAVREASPKLANAVIDYLAENKGQFSLISRQVKARGRKNGDAGRYRPRINALTTVMDASRGIISPYDDLFKSGSLICHWDWRLLAAQAYQESGFDSQAVSRAGAMGVMQLMPGTARQHGVNPADLFTPSVNIRGAVAVINFLDRHYSDITDRDQRINFILAAYNGGIGHIDDARRLALKKGLNQNVWNGNVDEMVLSLMQPHSYRDPVVQYGYMRGRETYGYVRSIRSLWNYYRSLRVSSPDSETSHLQRP